MRSEPITSRTTRCGRAVTLAALATALVLLSTADAARRTPLIVSAVVAGAPRGAWPRDAERAIEHALSATDARDRIGFAHPRAEDRLAASAPTDGVTASIVASPWLIDLPPPSPAS
ncbi:MAG: hypothetical protein AAFX79_11170 [Planctomycetota bacterium]